MARYLAPTASATPAGVIVEVVDGSLYAQAVGLSAASGTLNRIDGRVAMVAEGSSYSETISGDVLTIPTLTGAGEAGAIESSGRRYAISLASLGIPWSGARRWCSVQVNCDGLSDDGAARAGTSYIAAWVGSGSSTDAVAGAALGRLSTGPNYGAYHFVTSSSSFTTAASGANLRGARCSFQVHHSATGQVHCQGLSDTATFLSAATSPSVAATDAAPSHLVVGLYRAGTNPSAFQVTGYKALFVFGPLVGSDGI